MTLSVVLKQLLHHDIIFLAFEDCLLMTIHTSRALFLTHPANYGATFLASL